MKVGYFAVVLLACFLQACSSFWGKDSTEMDGFVTGLMDRMTVREKLGQLNLPSGGDLVTGTVMNGELTEMIRKQEITGFFNVKGVRKIREMQRIAVEETRLKIPLIVGADVIHGYETIFPIPLAMSCSWDTVAIRRMTRVAATEASADGICWNFSPMVDICRDARWGRIAEGNGEDPYLGALMARAYVHGYQGDAMKANNEILASLTIKAKSFLSVFFLIPQCIPAALKPFAAQTPPEIYFIITNTPLYSNRPLYLFQVYNSYIL